MLSSGYFQESASWPIYSECQKLFPIDQQGRRRHRPFPKNLYVAIPIYPQKSTSYKADFFQAEQPGDPRFWRIHIPIMACGANQ
jgi:hypothetical protein